MNAQHRHLADSWIDVGAEHFTHGRYADAERCYRQAVDSDPMQVAALNALGATCIRQERVIEGTQWLERAVLIDPTVVGPWANLTAAYVAADRVDDAERAGQEALARNPTHRDTLMNLAMGATKRGELERACAYYERVIAAHPDVSQAYGNQIFLRDLLDTTAEEALRLRRRWYDRFGRPLLAEHRPHPNDRTPGRRLRVGYVTADIRQHSAVFIFGPMLTDHDPAVVDPVVYHSAGQPDEVTAYYRARSTCWRDVAQLDDAQLAALIREDRIDILVDLSGHSAGSRLPVFCRKPAPVQVTAWGHAHGTGIDGMDAFFADPIAVPPSEHHWYTERIVDLPCIVCYAPSGQSAATLGPAPAPMAHLGVVTFGSLNRAEKLSDDCWTTWGQLLRRLPGSRLLVKAGSFDRPPMLARVYRQLAEAGIDRSRLIVAGGSAHHYALEAYHHIDVVLDSFPHAGGVTTLEALWMGVPVVTLLGERPGGRTTASVLHVLGLDDWITRTPVAYIDRAVRAVSDVIRLNQLRGGLRARLEASVLRSRDYVRAVEMAYRDCWQRWCASVAP